MRRKNSCVGVWENFPTPEKADCWDPVLGCWFELKLRLLFGQKKQLDPVLHVPHRVT